METIDLLRFCTKEEALGLTVLQNAYTNSLKRAGSESSSANLKNMSETKRLLGEEKMRLEEKYKDDVNPVPTGPKWENFVNTPTKLVVLIFLQETGWEVKKSTFYDSHCATGKLKKNRNGVYTKTAVKKYAETWLVHGGLGTTVPEDDENLSRIKLQSEIARIDTAEERDRFKLEVERGKYIARDQMDRELAARAVVLDNGLDYLFRAFVHEMVALVGGDADKAPLLLDFCLKKKDEQLNLYANLEDFTVVMEEE